MSNGDAMSDELCNTKKWVENDSISWVTSFFVSRCVQLQIPWASVIVILFISNTIGGMSVTLTSLVTSIVSSPVLVPLAMCGWMTSLE